MEQNFEIVEAILRLDEEDRSGFHKELNLISWNDRRPKYDIRGWNEDHTRMTKGVTLNKEEMEQFAAAALEHIGKGAVEDGV